MNIDELTVGQVKEISGLIKGQFMNGHIDNKMVGKYVIVRCHDAGVHAGVLESYSGRECVLLESRRLWYWKPANKKSFLSGVAVEGLDSTSKVGTSISRIHLTENCEIIECSEKSAKSIREALDHDQ